MCIPLTELCPITYFKLVPTATPKENYEEVTMNSKYKIQLRRGDEYPPISEFKLVIIKQGFAKKKILRKQNKIKKNISY